MAWAIFKSKEAQLEDYRAKAVNELVERLDTIVPNNRTHWANYAQNLVSGNYDHADTMHNIFSDFGYPDNLEIRNYLNIWRRFGVAKAVVEIFPTFCWLTEPTITSDNEQFNSEVKQLIEKNKLFERLKGLDIRQRIGRYGGLFMRVRDGKQLNTEVGKLSGTMSLLNIQPMDESQLDVIKVDEDERSERFGEPLYYQFDSTAVGNRNENLGKTFEIHPSRVVIAAEGADDGSIFGISALEAVFNDLMDLRKISGAGGEGFYQNTRNAPFFEAGADFNFDSSDENAQNALESAIDEWLSKHRKRLMLQGVKPHYPNIQLSQPKEFAQNSINNISAGTNIPSAMLVGQQTGRLASEKDMAFFLSVVQSRRKNFLTDMTKSVIDWCIDHAILPSAEYSVVWDDIMATSDTEKFNLGKMMVEMNKWSFDAGGTPIYTEQQIQEKTGYEAQVLERLEEAPDRDRSGEKLTKPDTGTNIDDEIS